MTTTTKITRPALRNADALRGLLASDLDPIVEGAFEAATLCSAGQYAAELIIAGDLRGAFYAYDEALEELENIEDAEGAELCEWMREAVDALDD